MAALIAVPLASAALLGLLADHARRHQADPDAQVLVLGPDGSPIDLPEGTRLAVPVTVRVTREPAVRPKRRRTRG